MQLKSFIMYVLILLVFINGSNQISPLAYAQSNNISDTSNIDTEVNDLLNKIGRGNIIDSTIDSLMQGMGGSLPPTTSSSPNTSLPPTTSSSPNTSLPPTTSSSPNSNTVSNTSNDVNNEIMSILKSQDPKDSSVATSQSKNQDMKYFAKIVQKNSNNENIISSNSLTEFNNNLLKFCLDSGIDYYSCSSIIQDSLQAAQFTSSYMGPAKVNTDLIGYTLELKIK